MTSRPPLLLPKRPITPYIRHIPEPPKKVKNMTIALGMKLQDGFVLAADRQMTSSDSHKYEEEKIFWIEGIRWNVFLTYCDSPDIAKEAAEKIKKNLAPFERGWASENYEPPSFENLITEVENTLNEIANKHYNNPPVQMLIIIDAFEDTNLFLYRDKAFHSVPNFEMIGAGDSSLLRFLKQMHSSKDTLENGRKLAVYMIGLASEFVDKCGKGMDIVSVSKREGVDWLKKELTEKLLSDLRGREIKNLRQILTG